MRIVGKLALAAIVGSVAVAQSAYAQSSDTQLAQEAKTLISTQPALKADGVYVDVVDGVAYVHGDVSSQIESNAAVTIVARVKGISRVVDSTSTDNS